MSVTIKDARTVLATILHTFHAYVCPGHESPDPDDLDIICDGMCQWDATLNPRDTETPTLYDYTQGEVSKGNWSIAWEGGNAPEYWTSNEELHRNIAAATNHRVHVEAINNCIMGVYAA